MLLRRATFLAVALLATSTASAEAVTVSPATPDGAPGSLRSAIDTAAGGETIDLLPGTYRLTLGQLNIDTGITVRGPGPTAGAAVITAEGRSRTLLVNTPSSVSLERLQVSGGAVSGGLGGGILKQGTGSLQIQEVAISGNRASGSQGGGGLAATAGPVTLLRSAVLNNTATGANASSGGAGLLHTAASQLNLENVTIAANTATVSGGAGGSGLLTTTGNASLTFVTIAYNSSSPAGASAMRNNGGGQPTLLSTMVQNNGVSCDGSGSFNSDGFNIDGNNTCDLNPGLGDQPGIIAGTEPPADNGGPTPTVRLPPGSRAINTGGSTNDNSCTVTEDQRNALRPADNESSCDVGAFEFEGWAQVQVPPCSRSGRLPFSIFSPPETGVEALDYTIDGGSVQSPLRVPIAGGANSGSGTIDIPEGRRRLEYWADSFPTGTQLGVQLKHATPLVVVDRTNPQVAVKNPNPFKVFVIKRSTKVDVSASDSISGLVTDPSGTRQIDTSQRGTKRFAPTATDLCANQQAAPFDYRVLAPKLGVRTVLERVKGTVRVKTATSGAARASQKGRSFSPVREPREIKVRSLVNARRGTVRLTSSRDRASGIQDGEFVGGLFQVLQSRAKRTKGLTELRLKGSSFKRCGSATGRKAGIARKRVIRRLRGNARGRFRTRGRYSAATVRGTNWTVEDRCDGTLTKVKRGKVAVRDFRRHKTVVVRKGKSYLARAPR